MNGHLTWYAARASGLVAWGLVLASIVWGLLLATRVLGRRPTPAWLLSLHRYLGALAVVFVGVHVGAILLDSYTSIGVVNVVVPFTGSWDPLADLLPIPDLQEVTRHIRADIVRIARGATPHREFLGLAAALADV